MNTLLAPPFAEPTADDPNLPHRWTTAQYYALAAAGAFDETGHAELLDGEIFLMPPQMTPHATAVRKTSNALRALYGADYDVSVQLPIALPDGSQPEPDVCVARGNADDFLEHHPTPAEIVLVVEVSDATLQKDRTRKAALYARAGIAEYWIANVIDRQLEVYRSPRPENGVYASQTTLLPGESVVPLAMPDAAPVDVSALLPLA